jgi:hypothetical protein
MNSLQLQKFTATGAKKLRVLSLGSNNSGISNTALTEMSIGSCENLEELYVARMLKLENLDLAGSPSIKIVDARNSNFTSISIPAGAPLKSLEVNKPSSIVLYDLTELEKLSFQDPTVLKKIDIRNIDESAINSKDDIIDLTSNTLEEARTLNVNWRIDTSTVNGEAEIDNSNNTIRILEKLKKLEFRTDKGELIPQIATLSGTLTIGANAYNSANSIDIYNKYAQIDEYPNLDIVFEGAAASLPKVSIYNGND